MSAPFHAALAEAPQGGVIEWHTARDDVRLRIGLWHPAGAKGTILLFPGRTEYIEKYGRVIGEMVEHGYAVATIDWRGQGYSDRLADDPALGHVGAFSDYQLDVAALVTAIERAGMPKPRYLVAHSLGGNIGLRSMIEGLDVSCAVFSAPMWGIFIPKHKRVAASFVPVWAKATGKGLNYLPGTAENTYLNADGFAENVLTTDKDHFDYLARQANAASEFALGGPSIHWFAEAQAECQRLVAAPLPKVPALAVLGTQESVVDPTSVRAVLENWPSAEFLELNDAQHELMMERPDVRTAFFDAMFAFFERA